MLKKSIYLLILAPYFLFAQVGIGTDLPDDSTILHLESNDSGLLIPKMDLVNVDPALGPIASPVNGLLVFNTNGSIVNGAGRGFYFFDSGLWRPINFRFNTLDSAYDGTSTGNGRTIIADSGEVTIAGEDGFLVTGTFGTGSGPGFLNAGERMSFNPNRAAFRAGSVSGTQWNATLTGNYSAAFGLDNTASGARSFAANNSNVADGLNATAFGRTNNSNGNSTFTTGVNNTATGLNAFTMGNENTASGDHSFVQGSENTAGSNNEIVLGAFASNYTVTDPNARDLNDRMFAVGIGAGDLSRKSGLEVWKDGRVVINDGLQEYTLPTTRGSMGDVITIDNATTGTTAWTTPERTVSMVPLNSDLSSTTITTTGNFDISGYEVPFIPTIYDSAGQLEVKFVIDYTSLTGDVEFRLRARGSASTSNVTTFPQFAGAASFNTISTGSGGGIIESGWVDWSAGTSPVRLFLQSRFTTMVGSEEIVIRDAYVLVRKQ